MRILVYVLALTWLIGCGGRHPQPASFSPDPQPFVDLLTERDGAIKSLTAELAVELWRGDERLRFAQMIAVDEAGRLRIDALSPMGTPISTLVSDGGRLMLYAVSEKRFYIGESSSENLSRLLPVAMAPIELSMLLRGAIPRIEAEANSLVWDATVGAYALVLEGAAGRQRIEFDAKSRDVHRLQRWSEDVLRYDVRFAKYEGQGSARIPKRINLRVPTAAIEIDLDVKNHRLNPDLPLETFQLKPPRGVVIQAF